MWVETGEEFIDLSKVFMICKNQYQSIRFASIYSERYVYTNYESEKERDAEYMRIKSLLLNLKSGNTSSSEG